MSNRKWWIILTFGIVLGPWLPMLGDTLDGQSSLEIGEMLCTLLWILAIVIPSSMLAWDWTWKRSTGTRILCAVAFCIAGGAVSLGLMFATCIVYLSFHH